MSTTTASTSPLTSASAGDRLRKGHSLGRVSASTSAAGGALFHRHGLGGQRIETGERIIFSVRTAALTGAKVEDERLAGAKIDIGKVDVCRSSVTVWR